MHVRTCFARRLVPMIYFQSGIAVGVACATDMGLLSFWRSTPAMEVELLMTSLLSVLQRDSSCTIDRSAYSQSTPDIC